MGSPNQIFGKATITLNGQVMATEPGAELTPGLGEREEVMGEHAPVGFSEKASPWRLKAKFFAKAGITATKLWNIVDATVLFEGDNGYRCTLVQATTKTVGALKTGEKGGWEVEMFAMRGNEE